METLFALLESFMIVGFVFAFQGGRRTRWVNLLFLLGSGILLFTNLMITSAKIGFSEYTMLFDILILALLALFDLKGPWYQMVFCVVIYQVSLIMANVGSFELLHVITGQDILVFIEPGTFYRGIALLSGKLLWGLELLLILFWKRRVNHRSFQWIPVILVALLCGAITLYATTIVLTAIRENRGLNQDYANQVIVVVIGVLFLNVLILALMGLVFYQKHKGMENALTQHMLEAQKQAYAVFINRYHILQKKQHDLKNVLLASRELIKREDYAALEATLEQIGKTFLQMEDENTGEGVAASEKSDSVMWRVLIEYQEEMLKKRGISFEKEIKSGNYNSVAGIDLCVVIGNLLDNAIEAEEKERGLKGDEEKGWISLYMEEQFGITYIKVRNTISQSVLKNQGVEVSSKKETEGHGYGIKGVKEIARKYQGQVVFSEEGNVFIVEVLLYSEKE